MNGENRSLKEFGRFRLDTERKVLWHKGEPVAMPLKEIELLCLLVEQRGELVTKEQLLETIWAESFVGESNLSRQIYLLRKTLKDLGAGSELIENIPRRGYRFTGEVNEIESDEIVIERHAVSQTLIEIQEKPGDVRTRSFLSKTAISCLLPCSLVVFFCSAVSHCGIIEIHPPKIHLTKSSQSPFYPSGQLTRAGKTNIRDSVWQIF